MIASVFGNNNYSSTFNKNTKLDEKLNDSIHYFLKGEINQSEFKEILKSNDIDPEFYHVKKFIFYEYILDTKRNKSNIR